jgi:hypothetical protein
MWGFVVERFEIGLDWTEKEKEREVGELGIQVKTGWRRWLASWLEQCGVPRS